MESFRPASGRASCFHRSTCRHHLEQNAFEIFRLWQSREHRMIGRLLESAKSPGRTPCVHQRLRDHLRECNFVDVMGAGKSSKQSIFRQELESANMELAITAHGVSHPALRSRKRGRIEDDQIALHFRFLGSSQKLENVLPDPLHLQLIVFRIFSGRRKAFYVCLDACHLARASARTRQRKSALTREAIEHTPVFGMLCNGLIVLLLIEIKTSLLSAQNIDLEL